MYDFIDPTNYYFKEPTNRSHPIASVVSVCRKLLWGWRLSYKLAERLSQLPTTKCLQHAATHCNTLQQPTTKCL